MSFKMVDNVAVCEALGIDPNVTRAVTLRFAPGQLPIAEVEQVIDGDSQDELTTMLRTFRLYEIEDEEKTG